MDDMGTRISAMERLLVEIDTKLDAALSKINDHEARLRMLEGKSGKRWESVVTQLVTALAAALVGFIAAKFV